MENKLQLSTLQTDSNATDLDKELFAATVSLPRCGNGIAAFVRYWPIVSVNFDACN